LKPVAILAAAIISASLCASFGQGVAVFDDVSNEENSVPGAHTTYTTSTPNTFMGDGYLLTPGTTNITGFDVFPVNETGTNFTGLQITIYVWGSVNPGTVNSFTPAFGNLLATYTATITQEFDSGFFFSIEGFPKGSTPGLALNPPLAVSGTNIGITINTEGTTDGTNYASYNDLTSIISYGTLATVGGEDFNGYYRNLNSETNGDFIEGRRTLSQTFQSLALRVFGTLNSTQLPVANPQSVSLLTNTSVNITLTGNDPHGFPLTYAIVDNPTNGSLSGAPPHVVYTPNANYAGADAFTFKVNDGTTDSVPATVSLSVGFSAGLIIIPTYDSTILSDPNVSAITNTINTAILSFESRYSDPVTVGITFAEMSSGLGQSQTFIGTEPYSAYYSALVAASKTTNDVVALANLPGGSTNPVNGSATITATLPLLRALGFSADAGGTDSTISVNMSLINITRPPADPNKYDLQTVVSHEIDEVLGTSSGVGQTFIEPVDLFRYSSTGTRNFTTSGDDANFSIDAGATLLARYNQNASGDYGDWWSVSAHSPVRVQDAFGTPGTAPDLGVELIVLDTIGWNLVSAGPGAAAQPMVHASLSGATINLTWNSTVGRIYQVQYNTNLTLTNWVDLGGPITALGSTTTTNDTTVANVERFYRVQLLPLPPSPAVVLGAAKSSKPIKGPLRIHKHVTHPRVESNPGAHHGVIVHDYPAQMGMKDTF
jgi:hypothetical protein